MFDNETPYPWRGAFVEWIGFTLLWSFIWMLPWILLASFPNATSLRFLATGSLGLPFISGYLLFRTVARLMTRETDPDKTPERITHDEMRAD